MNILINSYSLSIGGGQKILNDFLQYLQDIIVKNKKMMIFVFVPNQLDYVKFENKQLKIFELPFILKKKVMRPLVNNYFQKKIEELEIDKVFSMGNIALNTQKPQLLLFHWAYAVYPDKSIWSNMDTKSYLNRKIRLYLFQKNLKYVNTVIAQTENIKQRLHQYYDIKNIVIIPNSVDMDSHLLDRRYAFNLPDGEKLLCLTHYYTHKNLEIFIPLAQKIKEKKLDYKIIITIAKNQHPLSRKLLKDISKYKLEDVIHNIGPVKFDEVSSLYNQCDALLMPTLLESFGLTYIEAMFFKLPILTSNRDFSRVLCKDMAFYFDPMDANNILHTIKKVFSGRGNLEEKVNKYESFLEGFPTSKEVAKRYIEEIVKL